jgi:hypothetical protein
VGAPKERAMRWEFALLVCLSGCPGTDPGTDPDAATGARTLNLAWTVKPTTFPGTVSGNTVIEDAQFSARSLRVIGDATGSNDPRTYVDKMPLEWNDQRSPDVHAFMDAPSGVYSRVVLELEGDHVYQISGTTVVGGNQKDFEIKDDFEKAISVTLDPQVNLAPVDTKTIRVQVDVTRIVGAVDFTMLPTRDGKLVLDSSDPQISEIRKKVGEAFTDDNSLQQ